MGDGRTNNITARWSDYIYPYTNFTETALSPDLKMPGVFLLRSGTIQLRHQQY